ncbi:protein PIGBOS1 [Entelurus aequoreus]|uniref:protein PIGBOS1 n=1 Tax=Entelurus aequoreus TaxID=161455 RepID=UPI002B1DC729|nr:protein PIGBOS1 [Entelurus aequoreus]
MFRKKLPFSQMALAAVLGVAGGFYIYRPYYDTTTKITTQQPNQDTAQKDKGTDGNKSC